MKSLKSLKSMKSLKLDKFRHLETTLKCMNAVS